eukprot:gene34527-biopygen22460
MSSVNAVLAIPGQVPYVTSKGAINQLTKTMALGLAEHGIRVNAIGPGTIATEILKGVFKDEAAKRGVLARTPLKRIGEPREIGRVAVFLASDDASYMTGQTIYPDGGRLALLAVQNIGDGLTSASLQQAYLDAAAKRTPGRAAGLWVAGAGHCTFDTPTVLASIGHLVAKLDSGRWPARPAGFVTYTPPPMLRPCVRGGACR